LCLVNPCCADYRDRENSQEKNSRSLLEIFDNTEEETLDEGKTSGKRLRLNSIFLPQISHGRGGNNKSFFI